MFRSMKLTCAAVIILLGTSAVVLPAKAQNVQSHFVGEVIFLTGNFCPVGTFPADGRMLPIAQNQPLFTVFGTTYGGNGQTTFALPKISGIPTQDRPLQVCVIGSSGVYPSQN